MLYEEDARGITMKFWLKIRYLIEYTSLLIPYHLIRILPYPTIRAFGIVGGDIMNLIPSIRKVVRSNIQVALPELSNQEVARIGRASLRNLVLNLAEFVWLDGKPDRIRRCYFLPPDITEQLEGHIKRGERIIFVNPHLGSWEASGVMAPFYAGVSMAAIARPIRNKYINRLFNHDNREKITGLKIIFSKGAIRASIATLKAGHSIGTLIDQNTKASKGGTFVNFFNLPVSSSPAPAKLKRYCDAHDIPAVIIYGTSVRHEDGKIHAHSAYLAKPFQEYQSDEEVLQELMKLSEKFIRQYPEQYLWFYRRFQYIPPWASDDLKSKYPFYAHVVNKHFGHVE